MTSGLRPPHVDRWLAAVLLLGAACCLPASAAGWDVASLMTLLASNPPGRAIYEETRTLALLDRPLSSSGELRFTPPGRLEKRMLAPDSETLVVDGDTLTVDRSGRRNTISLQEHPEVAVFVECIRGTLAGDRVALERVYSLAIEGEAKRWNLVLKPLTSDAGRLVARIEVGGHHADISRIEIFLADGDRSLMTIRRKQP